MKKTELTFFTAALMFSVFGTPANASPEAFPDGITFDDPDSYISGAFSGGIYAYSQTGMLLQVGAPESSPGTFDGGIHLVGAPVRLCLGSDFTNDGKFEVWGLGDFSGVGTSPMLAIDSSANTAAFQGVNVSISGGTLTLGGSPVATQSSLPVILEGLSGKVVIGNGTATGTSAVAIGLGSATASGNKAVAFGEGTRALTYAESALGIFNASASGDATQWIGTDTLLSLGNGTSSGSRSDALRVLKNGLTTIVNKTWNSSTPLADPNTGDSSDSGGDALDVKGHTTLEGKVTILTRQGDVSMGIYD